VWVSSSASSAPASAVRRRRPAWKPSSGRIHPGVRDRSLGHHARDVAAAQLALHPVEVVVLDEAHVLGRVARDPQAFGRDAVVLERAEQLVGVAVVLAVEHHHAVAAGDRARHPQRLGVRLRGRERELPHRQPEAVAERAGDRGRVDAGQQEVAPRGQALGHACANTGSP